MRRYVASLVFAGSLMLVPSAMSASTPDTRDRDRDAPAVAVQQARVVFPKIRDEAAMVLVGTALIALAAAVRRAL